MSEQELCEQFEDLFQSQVEYIADRIHELSYDETQHPDAVALYEEYREFMRGDDVDIICINSETGSYGEYCMEYE